MQTLDERIEATRQALLQLEQQEQHLRQQLDETIQARIFRVGQLRLLEELKGEALLVPPAGNEAP